MKRTRRILTVVTGILLMCSSAAYSADSSAKVTLHPVTPATAGIGNGCLRIMPKGLWYFLAPVSVSMGDQVLDGTNTLDRRNGDQVNVIPRIRLSGGLGHGWEFTAIAPFAYSTHSDEGKEYSGNMGDLTVNVRREIYRKGGFAFGAGGGFDLPTGETDGNNIPAISNEQWKFSAELGSTYFWGDLERHRFDATLRGVLPLGDGADGIKTGYLYRLGLAYGYAVNRWLDVGYEAYWMKNGTCELGGIDMNNGSEEVWHGPKIALKNVIPLKGSMLALSFLIPAYQWADGNNINSVQANFASDYQVSLKFGYLL